MVGGNYPGCSWPIIDTGDCGWPRSEALVDTLE
jgi:hypothetical protein